MIRSDSGINTRLVNEIVEDAQSWRMKRNVIVRARLDAYATKSPVEYRRAMVILDGESEVAAFERDGKDLLDR